MTVKKRFSGLRRAWEGAVRRYKRFASRNMKVLRLAIIFAMLLLLATAELMVLAHLLSSEGDSFPAEYIAPVELESLKL